MMPSGSRKPGESFVGVTQPLTQDAVAEPFVGGGVAGGDGGATGVVVVAADGGETGVIGGSEVADDEGPLEP